MVHAQAFGTPLGLVQSYARLKDGDGEVVGAFHVDRFGIVRTGEYVPPPEGRAPLWVQPEGAHDSYPLNDVLGEPTVVELNDRRWQNTVAANTQAPGGSGWTDLGSVSGEPDPPAPEYPAWVPWDGHNENLHQVGDRVTHNARRWEANVGNNHWEPGVFGWTDLGPA